MYYPQIFLRTAVLPAHAFSYANVLSLLPQIFHRTTVEAKTFTEQPIIMEPHSVAHPNTYKKIQIFLHAYAAIPGSPSPQKLAPAFKNPDKVLRYYSTHPHYPHPHSPPKPAAQ